MNLPSPPSFRAEDFPDVPPRLLELLNRGFRDAYEALVRVRDEAPLERRSFTTDGSGLAYLDLKNPLPRRPVDVVVGELRPESGAPITTTYSATWSIATETIRVLFTGLAASTKYFATVTVK